MAPVTPMASNFLVPNGTFWVELAAFVVMFLILRRYVIPPINKAMEARQDAIRQEFAEANPGLVKDAYGAFIRSRELSLERVDEVAESAARWEDFDAATLKRYFTTLDFSLGERQLAGMAEFARRVGPRIGLAPLVQPIFIEV